LYFESFKGDYDSERFAICEAKVFVYMCVCVDMFCMVNRSKETMIRSVLPSVRLKFLYVCVCVYGHFLYFETFKETMIRSVLPSVARS
jgi:hypothetical protein